MLEKSFTEDIDWTIVFPPKGENPLGGRPTEEIYLTLTAAEHFAMQAQTAQGKVVRQFFIDLVHALQDYHTEQAERVHAEAIMRATSDQILASVPDGQGVFYTGYAGLLKGVGETDASGKGKAGCSAVSMMERFKAHVREYGSFFLTSAIPTAHPAELERNVKQSRLFRNSQIDVPYGEEGKVWTELFDLSKVSMDQMIKHAKKLNNDMLALGGPPAESTELSISKVELEREREKTKQIEAQEKTKQIEAQEKTKQTELELMKLRLQTGTVPAVSPSVPVQTQSPLAVTPSVPVETPSFPVVTSPIDVYDAFISSCLVKTENGGITTEVVLKTLQDYLVREEITDLDKFGKNVRLHKLDEKLLPQNKLNDIRVHGKEAKNVRRFGPKRAQGYDSWAIKVEELS